MKKDFKVGDQVGWNSEAGHVRGTIKKKITSAITFKGYTVRASKEDPQYLIKSETTDHLAMHKGAALKKLKRNNNERAVYYMTGPAAMVKAMHAVLTDGSG